MCGADSPECRAYQSMMNDPHAKEVVPRFYSQVCHNGERILLSAQSGGGRVCRLGVNAYSGQACHDAFLSRRRILRNSPNELDRGSVSVVFHHVSSLVFLCGEMEWVAASCVPLSQPPPTARSHDVSITQLS